MKQVKILKSNEVETREYIPHSFTQNRGYLSSMQILEQFRKNNTKRYIRKLAKKSDILYDDEKIIFAEEMINIMLNEMSNEK